MTQPLSIVMYVNLDCEDSEMALVHLLERGIPFEEVDIEENEAGAQYVERITGGYRSTPTIVFGDETFIVVEPDLTELNEALQRAGY